jgi:dipeptidase D
MKELPFEPKRLGEPTEFWEYFEKISKIPRCSGKEEKIRVFIDEEARKFSFETKIDKVRNLLVRIPAISKEETHQKIILQSHLDMVCEKNENIKHDFSRDPLKIKVVEIDEEKWVTADGTTLGADNGSGVAYQLALMKKVHDGELSFGTTEIDLLFTVNEEEGLIGAFKIDKSFIDGDFLINFDGSKDDNIVIGCAGGSYTYIDIDVKKEIVNFNEEELIPIKISVKGLLGGHSGKDIIMGRANSIKLLATILWKLNNRSYIRINSISGGNKSNAIPRESKATLFVKNEFFSDVSCFIKRFVSEIKIIYSTIEPNIEIAVEKLEDNMDNAVFEKEFQEKLLDILYLMPHGPILMHPEIKGLVHTSTNFASISTEKNQIKLITMQRSFTESCNTETYEKIRALFKLSGIDAKLKYIEAYGAWSPEFNFKLLDLSKEAYKDLYKEDPIITAFHVGYECGIFRNKFPDLQMIVIGPNIVGNHSPNERIHVQSVEKTWKFLINLLKRIQKD